MRTGGVGGGGGHTGQTAHVGRRLYARAMQEAHGLEGSHPRKLSWGKGVLSLMQGFQDRTVSDRGVSRMEEEE